MNSLSKRQEAILHFINEQVTLKGYPPSVREIGEGVGLASSSTVHGHLSRLEKKGYIRRDPTKPRAIEIIKQEQENGIPRDKPTYVPIIGKVTAGLPITAIENVEEFIPLPSSMAQADAKLFALIIQGDSMIEAGILEDDVVIVKKQQDANNGEIVVAMTEDDEATVKRFFKESNRVRLQPENATMEPLIYDTVTILGKVIGVFRHIK